jgi:dodecin
VTEEEDTPEFLRKARDRNGRVGKGAAMAIADVIEISATSPKSFEDAINAGIARATQTLENVTGAWIKEQTVRVENGKVSEYRVNMKLTFILKS